MPGTVPGPWDAVESPKFKRIPVPMLNRAYSLVERMASRVITQIEVKLQLWAVLQRRGPWYRESL